MEEITKTTRQKEDEIDFSFSKLFVPLTTVKAIHWIIFIGIIVYFNALFNSFVWDDFTYMINNPAIHVFNVFSFFGVNNMYNGQGFYRPIPAVYISLLLNLFGTTAFFYHAIQILLQIMCSCLVFFFLKRFFSIQLSFFLSLIFLVHPIQTESVAYISGTQNNLFFLFGMIALLISIKEKLYVKKFLLTSLFLLLSLFSKETGFLFLVMILLYQYFYNRQYVVISLVNFTGVLFIYFFVRFGYAHNYLWKNLTIPIAQLSFAERLINIPAIFFYYIQTFFYPSQLSIDQQWTVSSLSFNDFILPLIIDLLFLLLILGLGIFMYMNKKSRKRFNQYLLFTIWFLLGIGLVLQIFPLDATVSDRWFYFPIVGLLGLLGIVFQTIQFKKIFIKHILITSAVLCIMILSIRTMVRNTNYVDQLTLFSHDSAIARNGFDLDDQLGIMYYQANNLIIAKKYFDRAVSELPCSDASSNLAILDRHVGNYQAALQDYAISLKCFGLYDNYENYVLMLYELHNLNQTEQYAKQGIQKYPQGVGLYYMLGVAEANKGDKTDALKNLNTAYQLYPAQKMENAINQVKNNEPATVQ